MTPLIAKTVKHIPELLDRAFEGAVFFEHTGTNWHGYPTQRIPPEEARLPFDLCALALGPAEDRPNEVWCALVAHPSYSRVEAPCITVIGLGTDVTDGEIDRVTCDIFWDVDAQFWQVNAHKGDNLNFRSIDPEEAARLIDCIFHFIKLANSGQTTGFARKENPTNKKRIAKGKKPLFDWHTVEIKPRVQSAPAKGEKTGIKHRLHDVRGHWCVMKATGTRYWRNHHKRGNASLGVVFHDYVVKP